MVATQREDIMKKYFLILFFVVITFSFAINFVLSDQSLLTVKIKSTPNLVGHWALDGNYNDDSGKGNHGKEVGDPNAFGWTKGVNGGKAIMIDSARFNGSFIDIPAPIGSVFDSPKATAIVWAKLTKRNGNYWQAIAERSNLWYIETEAKPAEWKGNAFVVRIYDPVAVGGGGSGQVRDNINVTLEDDKWYQLAWTYDGAVLNCYLNGSLVLRQNYAGGLGPNANTPKIPPADKGKNYNLSLGTWQQRDDWFTGAIDDFCYFVDVLSEAKIKEFYDAMLSPSSEVTMEGKISTFWGEIKKR